MPGFDIGHLILLSAIALLVFGPDRLQEMMRTVARTLDEFKRASQGLPSTLISDYPVDGTGPENAAGWSDLGGGRPMTLVDHINELRSRILYAAIPILAAAGLCFYFSDWILSILKAPGGPAFQINGFGPMDGFAIRWKVALFGGIILAAPFWIYELLAFVAPAMTPRERRFFYPILAAVALLFLLGSTFGYLMLGGMLHFMFTMYGTEINYLPNASQYISFVVFFTLVCGLVFELPIALLVLVRLGVLTPQQLRHQRRIAYFLLFVFAELITPVADPIVAPLIVMTPLVILYEGAIFCTRFVVSGPEPGSAQG
jgi:sec-independent protein translocase protein TatC